MNKPTLCMKCHRFDYFSLLRYTIEDENLILQPNMENYSKLSAPMRPMTTYACSSWKYVRNSAL